MAMSRYLLSIKFDKYRSFAAEKPTSIIFLQALRVSMEEQRARQEAEARKAASETPGGESAERQTGGINILNQLHLPCFQ